MRKKRLNVVNILFMSMLFAGVMLFLALELKPTLTGAIVSDHSFVNILNAPALSSLILNTTDIASNDTTVNLTAYNVSDTATKVIYNWLLNGTSIAVLNMPFEKINNTEDALNYSAWDYSGYGNNGSVTGAFWNATGGYDSKGAYQFDGINDYINLGEGNGKFDFTTQFSIVLWVKVQGSNTYNALAGKYAGEDYLFDFILENGKPLMTLRNLTTGVVQRGTTCSSCSDMRNNRWYHIAVVVNTTSTKIYEDGILNYTNSVGTWAPGDSSANLIIGDRAAGSLPLNGTIDEVMIFNRSLSAEQIFALFNNRTDLIVAQETNQGENWTVIGYPNNGTGDGAFVQSNSVMILASRFAQLTSLIPAVNSIYRLPKTIEIGLNAAKSDGIISQVLVNITYPNSSMQQIELSNSTGNPDRFNISYSIPDLSGLYSLIFIVNDSNNQVTDDTTNFTAKFSPIITSLVLNTTNISTNSTNVNLTAYNVSDNATKIIYNWLLNGTSIAVLNMPFEGINETASNNAGDYSGYGNNGSENNGAIWNATGGYDGKGAYQFDGINDYISIPNSASLNITNGLTISLRLKGRVDTATYHSIIGRYAADNYMFDLILTNGRLNLVLRNISGTAQNNLGCGSCADMRDNNWYHVVITANRSIAKIYQNGVLASSQSGTWTPGSSTANLIIGDRTPAEYPFNGTIDDVMIFNRSLSAEQVRALFNNRTDIITASETQRGDNWTVIGYPNDGSVDGAFAQSNSVLITNATVPIVDEVFVKQYKNDMAWIYNEIIQYPKAIGFNGSLSSYADVPLQIPYSWLYHENNINWSNWTSSEIFSMICASETRGCVNYIVFNYSNFMATPGEHFYALGNLTDQTMDIMMPSAYYAYRYGYTYDLYTWQTGGERFYWNLFEAEANAVLVPNKPIIVFQWMRLHPSDATNGMRGIDPWLAHATAIFPYFTKNVGHWLWDWIGFDHVSNEPRMNASYTSENRIAYDNFIYGLYRLSQYNEFFNGNYQVYHPTDVRNLRRAEAPIWRAVIKEDESQMLVAAFNPYANFNQATSYSITCPPSMSTCAEGAVLGSIQTTGLNVWLGSCNLDGSGCTGDTGWS